MPLLQFHAKDKLALAKFLLAGKCCRKPCIWKNARIHKGAHVCRSMCAWSLYSCMRMYVRVYVYTVGAHSGCFTWSPLRQGL